MHRLEKNAKAKLRHLYDEDGRANAKAIAKELGWRVPTLAGALGLDAEALKKDPVSKEFQKKGHRIGRLLETLFYLFGEQKTVMGWLKRRHPDLRDSVHGKQSPLEVIKLGHLEAVEGIIDGILTGQPG